MTREEIEQLTPNDFRYVSWFPCDCDWVTKYCEENHHASARIPVSVLNEYTTYRAPFNAEGTGS